MEEDQTTQLERMKKAQEELQGKIDRMMDTMAKITKRKQVVENPISQEGHACQNSKEDPLHSPRFTHHHAQASQKAYIPKIPPVGGYPHTYTPPFVGQLPI